VCWKGCSVAIRITTGTLEATLVEGESMEMRVADRMCELKAGKRIQVLV
jgi:hypothetical protein